MLQKNTTATKSGRGNNTKNLSPFHSSAIFVVFHPLYLPLAAAINQNPKVVVRKGINVENMEFQCISFADDVTCFLHHKKPGVGQFLTAHIRMINAQDLSSLKQDKEEAHCFNGQFYHGQEVICVTNVNEPIEIFGMMFFTYDKHKKEIT